MMYDWMSSRLRMTRAALRRCLTSRYDEGSSNIQQSACCAATTPMAKRCSSPPDRSATDRPSTGCKSSSSMSSSFLSRSSFWSSTSSTLPRTALGMWSTYCGLTTAFKLSSRIRVK
mmetsp:Transcript_14102/g.44142  ORF Transcript_14102/g.44142 Transcript_14102/m.44142 type:complete len:116 (-) Transcript_14102:563-910(-)